MNNPNQTPTEKEIQQKAAEIFPTNLEMQSSFILGACHTIYNQKERKADALTK